MRKLLLIVLIVALSGCMSLAERKKEGALDAALSSYRTAMRWGHWETLLSYRHKDAPTLPSLDLENIRVTSYEVRQPPVPVKEDTVHQVVEIQYVMVDEQRLRKLLDNQKWLHDKESNQWRVMSDFPAFN